MDEPIRLIMRWLLFPLFVLLLFYMLFVGVTLVVQEQTAQTDTPRLLNQLTTDIRTDLGTATASVWNFVRPLLQLGIVLLIIYSFVKSLGIDVGVSTRGYVLSIQTVLAFLVVGGFVVASLLSDNPASWLKDLSLVVVGFYFGSRTRGWDDPSFVPEGPNQPNGGLGLSGARNPNPNGPGANEQPSTTSPSNDTDLENLFDRMERGTDRRGRR